uniref:Uncharacterized protein n=1 Tax=Setaria italica TaxID=4555 RepID=K3Y0B9_SETIT
MSWQHNSHITWFTGGRWDVYNEGIRIVAGSISSKMKHLKRANTDTKFISTNKHRSIYNSLVVQCCLVSRNSPNMKLSKNCIEKKMSNLLYPIYDS